MGQPLKSGIVYRDGVRLCSTCKERPARNDGKRFLRCKPCVKEYMRWYVIKQKYGITKTDWEAILETQGGTCALCFRTEDLVVDHCHETNAVRGILCRAHNVAIGNLGDTAESVKRAVAYLEASHVV